MGDSRWQCHNQATSGGGIKGSSGWLFTRGSHKCWYRKKDFKRVCCELLPTGSVTPSSWSFSRNCLCFLAFLTRSHENDIICFSRPLQAQGFQNEWDLARGEYFVPSLVICSQVRCNGWVVDCWESRVMLSIHPILTEAQTAVEDKRFLQSNSNGATMAVQSFQANPQRTVSYDRKWNTKSYTRGPIWTNYWYQQYHLINQWRWMDCSEEWVKEEGRTIWKDQQIWQDR